MQFHEAGKLNLDEPLARHLPPSSRFVNGPLGKDVKVRHVLSHTSESRPPGEAYAYSSARFSLLTTVAESIGGKPFRELLAERVLDRVTMPRTVPGQDVTDRLYRETLADLARAISTR